jgi:hypothetical protein
MWISFLQCSAAGNMQAQQFDCNMHAAHADRLTGANADPHQQGIAVGLLDDAADATYVLSRISEHHQVQSAFHLQDDITG